jgi:hypothetical protein
MTLSEFIKKYDGKTIDFDKRYGGQCQDAFNQYCVEVWNIPNPIQQFPVASAYQNFGYAKNNPNFITIPNDPTAVPMPGDVIIWNQGVGPHGHVGIFVEGDVMNFKAFEQNWAGIQKCRIVNHPYDHVTGWFRPKRNVPEATPAPVYTPEPVVAPTPVVAPEPIPAHTHTEPVKETPRPLIDMSALDGNKTKIITGFSIVVAILASQGYIDDKLVETINMITTALIGYTLRDAIKKK